MASEKDFANLRVYRLAEKLADDVWRVVIKWEAFAKATFGRQLVNSADGVGANIAEGSGRGSFQDNRRFIRMARGSLNETRYWLRRANKRGLLTSEQVCALKSTMDELRPLLNAYLRAIDRLTVAQRTNNKILITKSPSKPDILPEPGNQKK